MSLFSRIVKGVVAAAQFVVKATVAVVHTVVQSVRDVVHVFRNESGTFGEKLRKSGRAITETVVRAGSVIKGEFDLLRNKVETIVTTGSADVSFSTLLAELLFMMSKLKAERDSATGTSESASQRRNDLEELIKAVSDQEMLILLKMQEERVLRLLNYAANIEADESMHDIQRLARLEVGKKFMTKLSEDKTLTSKTEKRFLDLIDKFLFNKLKDNEVIELDEMIEKREGRTLLALGNEFLVLLYELQLGELKTTIDTQADELESMEQAANPAQSKEIEALKAKLEDNKILLVTTNALLLVTQGFQFVYDHEMEFYEGGRLSEDEWVIEKCMEVSNFFIEVVRTKAKVDPTKLREIEAFGRTIRTIRTRFGDLGNEGTTSVS